MDESPKKTVFVVGAGASCEFGFPSGRKLQEVLRGLLQVRAAGMVHPAARIATGKLCQRTGLNRRKVALEAELIYKTIAVTPSIDYCIHQHRDYPAAVQMAKWAICHAILEREKESGLLVNNDHIYRHRDTWLARLFERVVGMAPERSNVSDRLEQIAFVTFNYDRVIEAYFEQGLKDSGHQPELLRKLTVEHAYGDLNPQGFGQGADHSGAWAEWSRIRTFTESMEESASGSIHSLIDNADNLIFLGCAYHQQNMDLLTSGNVRQKKILATTYDLSDADAYKGKIRMARLSGRDPVTRRVTAFQLVDQYLPDLGLVGD